MLDTLGDVSLAKDSVDISGGFIIENEYFDIDNSFEVILDEIKDKYEKGQPILVGTASVEKSEATYLKDIATAVGHFSFLTEVIRLSMFRFISAKVLSLIAAFFDPKNNDWAESFPYQETKARHK